MILDEESNIATTATEGNPLSMRFLGAVLTATILVPGLAAAQNPPRIKRQPTPPANQKPTKTDNTEAPSAPPLGEMQFYRLVQQIRQREMNPDEAERLLSERGIAFEVTDETLARARSLGASDRLITALVRADDFRRTGGLSVQQPEAAPESRPPSSRPTAEDYERREQERIAKLPLLEQARAAALGALDELPDFTASQTIQRSMLVRGKWELRDTLETKVSYENKSGEKVQLISIDGRPTNKTYDDVGGSTSVGSFSSQLAAPLQPSSNGTFTEAGRERYRGRDCSIYRFTVPQASSTYQLHAVIEGGPEKVITIGYSGRMWIDRESKRILRVEQEAENIPPGFPMTQSEVTVDYDWVTISGVKYWMPIRAESLQGFGAYNQSFLNVTDFRDYRKFDGDVKVVD